MTLGIVSWGAYVPPLRLSRSAIADAHAWMAPSLRAQAKGERAFCNWDENAVTMAVEAARTCLSGRDRSVIGELVLASTTAPGADLQSSAIAAVALQLAHEVKTSDTGGSQRAGIGALAGGFHRPEATLVVASDRPRARPASAQEMQYGAGAAAFLLGTDDVAAELVATASSTALFVDHFRAADASHDYFWEERWIRDEGYLKIGVEAVQRALRDADTAAADVAHFVFPAPMKGIALNVARKLGIKPEAVADTLDAECGYAGTAHGLLQLASVLDRAEPGEVIVATGFGQGCEAIVLRTTDAVVANRPATSVADVLGRKLVRNAYAQMASFYQEIRPEWGMRAERDTKTALTEQYRSADMVTGFIAGKCGTCGQVQFPQLSYCVNCLAPSSGFTGLPLADEPATVITFTADFLAYHPSPPLYVGFAQFDVGARLLMEFVDVDAATFDVGARLGMRFRIKEQDDTRGYQRYFWKAAPSE